MATETFSQAVETFLETLRLNQLGEGKWNHFKIIHTAKKPSDHELKIVRERLHSIFPRKAAGIYAYESKAGELLYIGKAKNLFNRVYSHYRETFIDVGGDKSGVWHYFFNANHGELKIFWTELEGERERHIVEQCLEVVKNTKFDKQFPKGNRKLPPKSTSV